MRIEGENGREEGWKVREKWEVRGRLGLAKEWRKNGRKEMEEKRETKEKGKEGEDFRRERSWG